MNDMSKAEAAKAALVERGKAKIDRDALKSEALTVDRDSPKFARHITVTIDGHDYTVRSDAHLNVEFVEYAGDQKIPQALRALLGSREWEKWKQRNREKDGFVRGIDEDNPENSPLGMAFEAVMNALDPTAGS